MASSNHPPHYIFISHSSLTSSTPSALSNILGHPAIQYHYANDSPLALLPKNPDEHVLIFDYDVTATSQASVQSISEHLIVTGLRIEDAPGAAAAEETEGKNDKMFIIETVNDNRSLSASLDDRKPAQTILAQFKQRNATLRRALLYPSTGTHIAANEGTAASLSPNSPQN